ncbi:MAG: cysteine hydrolase [Chloroflexi bacterium]|nr:cysteine hydrolase [Chloroflexota bacterium]
MDEMNQFSNAEPFLVYLTQWMRDLPRVKLGQAIPQPDNTAILSVDVVNGFCNEGPLSSPRVAQIVQPIMSLFERAWDAGVRQVVLAQDTHDPAAVEFAQWPAHCVRGSSEAETVDEFKSLPFFDQMLVMPKNSINAALNTPLTSWLFDHPHLDNFIVVGDCTDLCTYQLAMFLRIDANARQIQRRVLVPANCVDTYDMTVESAEQLGALPHPAELLHAIFLYHMSLNGVEIVQEISA